MPKHKLNRKEINLLAAANGLKIPRRMKKRAATALLFEQVLSLLEQRQHPFLGEGGLITTFLCDPTVMELVCANSARFR